MADDGLYAVGSEELLDEEGEEEGAEDSGNPVRAVAAAHGAGPSTASSQGIYVLLLVCVAFQIFAC